MEQAARQAFARLGPVAARVEDIAAAAGLSKAAFYLYFESKATLFEALVREFYDACASSSERRHHAFEELAARIGPCNAQDWAERTPRLQQFAALDRKFNLEMLELLWQWRDMLECLLDRSGGPERDQFGQLIGAMLSTVSGRVEEAMRRGWLRDDVDPSLATDILMGAWLQLGRRMFRMTEPPDFEAWARGVETILNEGLRPVEESP